MRRLTFVLAASLLAFSATARAQVTDPRAAADGAAEAAVPAGPLRDEAKAAPVVLELYTSQGCSSCPPADALLASLAGRAGVIALALHVDYWDYLGWKDEFGLSANTQRQRAYAKKMHSRSIYTPQMIVQGEDRLIGHDAEKIAGRIEAHRTQPAPVGLEIGREGDELVIELTALGPDATPADVHVVRFIPAAPVAIGAGENAGMTITYTNIVTSWDTVARWEGAEPLEVRYPAAGNEPVVVIVQRAKMGKVLTAARYP